MEKNPRKMMGCLKRHLRAFSVAEMVIILSLVGFVSSVAVGTVTKHVNEQKMEFAGVVTNNEVAISLADMHASEELVGLASEEEFANKLQKHYDVDGAILNKDGTKSSGGSANLADMTYDEFVNKNFAASYTDTANNKTIKASDYNTVLKTAKGASIALTYNRSCSIGSSYTSSGTDANAYTSDAKNTALGCIEGIYDVNGSKGPNKLGVDVGVFQNVKGNCEGNFVMDASGQCGKVCALTTTNCKAENKTLNKDTCACECTVSCPKGQTLDKETCTCVCDNPVEFNEVYCRLDNTSKSKACTPIPKSYLTPAKCLSGGGKWAGDTCDCNCEAKDCKSGSYSFGVADPDQYCDCKCKFTVKNAEFDAIVRANAMKDGLSGDDLEQAVARTIPARGGQLITGGCYACDPSKTGGGSNISYSAKNGYCAAECDSRLYSQCDTTGGFFTWQSFNPHDVKNSCKCVCNSAEKKAEAEALNATLHSTLQNRVLLMNDVSTSSYRPTDWGGYRSMSLVESSTNTWDYIKDAVVCGQYWRKDNNKCAYKHTGNSCTYCPHAYNSSKTREIAAAWDNGGVPKDKNKLAKYVFNDSQGVCAFEFQNVGYKASDLVDQTHFHGVAHIWYGFDWYPELLTLQKYAQSKGIGIPAELMFDGTYNPNHSRPRNVPNFTWYPDHYADWWWNSNMKVALGSSYRKWGDPIVLNYTDTPEQFPTVIGGDKDPQNVNFKLAFNGVDGYEVVNTPWISAHTDMNKSHLFLATVNPADPADLVPDVSYLFSDQKPTKAGDGSLYSTGLDQLKDEFDTTVDNNENGVNTGLVNKNDIGFTNLRVWWDKNMDAKATADEIKTLDEAKITEFNTVIIRQTDATGQIIQSENAVYGITGQYKRLVEIGTELSDLYLGISSKEYVCTDTKQCKWGKWNWWTNSCDEYEQSCKWVTNKSDIRYVQPAYDKDGNQILDKWALILNDEEKASLERKFQQKVDAAYDEKVNSYDDAIAARNAERDKIGQEAYNKAKADYLAAWQAAKEAKSAADKAKAEAEAAAKAAAEAAAKAEAEAKAKAEAEAAAKAAEEAAKAEATEGEEATEPAEGENTEVTEGEEATEPAEGENTEVTEGEEATEPAEGENTEATEGENAEATEGEEATEPEVEEEATEPEAPAYDEELASLTQRQAENKAKEAGNKAKAEAMAAVSYDDIKEPTREAVEAELRATQDDNTYYTYSPKEEANSVYKERWFDFKENQTYDIELNKSFIKVYKIGDKYYEEKIYSLSDVLFKY